MVLNKLVACTRALLPALVVSCKCDAPQRQLNPNSIEQVGNIGGYETMQTSAALPDSQKKCVGNILNKIIKKNGLCAPALFFAFGLVEMHFVSLTWWLLLCAFSCFVFAWCPFLVTVKLVTGYPPENPIRIIGAGGMFILFRLQVPLSLSDIYFLLPKCRCGKRDRGRGDINHPSRVAWLG